MKAAREKLVGDIRELLTDVEALFHEAAKSTGAEAQELRERAESALRQAAQRFESVEEDLLRRGREAARSTDDWVHENPWSSIGIGAGIGLLVGMLIARR
jgi:ElaB/YqjD/DUF883 family membrane-anchored ribosome-binding protein